jgi:hypothetical protein
VLERSVPHFFPLVFRVAKLHQTRFQTPLEKCWRTTYGPAQQDPGVWERRAHHMTATQAFHAAWAEDCRCLKCH